MQVQINAAERTIVLEALDLMEESLISGESPKPLHGDELYKKLGRIAVIKREVKNSKPEIMTSNGAE